jgi:DNA-binding MarR family transcriptional regulator
MMATVPLLEGLGMSRQGAARHLGILEKAGIIKKRTAGRVIYRELQTEQLARANQWLENRTRAWESTLDRLQAFVENP